MNFNINDSLITILESGEINIENYRRILEYTDAVIRIQTKQDCLKIVGTHLQIEYYSNEEMTISGQVTKIEFGKQELK